MAGTDDKPFTKPDRIAVDAMGFCWRVWDHQEFWSMCPVNPDNSPIPQPVVYYIPVDPDEPHVIEFRAWDWTLRHPLSCRYETGLFDCQYNRAGELMEDPPIELGRFAVKIEDGELKVLHRVDE